MTVARLADPAAVVEAAEKRDAIRDDSGNVLGYIVSADDLALFEELEDLSDLLLAEEARREGGKNVPIDEVFAGLDW